MKKWRKRRKKKKKKANGDSENGVGVLSSDVAAAAARDGAARAFSPHRAEHLAHAPRAGDRLEIFLFLAKAIWRCTCVTVLSRRRMAAEQRALPLQRDSVRRAHDLCMFACIASTARRARKHQRVNIKRGKNIENVTVRRARVRVGIIFASARWR